MIAREFGTATESLKLVATDDLIEAKEGKSPSMRSLKPKAKPISGTWKQE